jgi:hypothetical protein
VHRSYSLHGSAVHARCATSVVHLATAAVPCLAFGPSRRLYASAATRWRHMIQLVE